MLNAGLIVMLSSDAPIGLVPEEFAPAPWLGVRGFAGAVAWLYGLDAAEGGAHERIE